MAADVAVEIWRYLRTGGSDPLWTAWEGGIFERGHRAHHDLRRALVDEVQRLAGDRVPSPLPEIDLIHLTRKKVEPMVRGLFPRGEQDAVLQALERSVVFLTAREYRARAGG